MNNREHREAFSRFLPAPCYIYIVIILVASMALTSTNWRTESKAARSRCMMVRLALGMPAACAAEAALEKSRQAMITCQSPLWPSAFAAASPSPEDAPVISTCQAQITVVSPNCICKPQQRTGPQGESSCPLQSTETSASLCALCNAAAMTDVKFCFCCGWQLCIPCQDSRTNLLILKGNEAGQARLLCAL